MCSTGAAFSDVLHQPEPSAHQAGLLVQQGQPDQAADVHQGPLCDAIHDAGEDHADLICWHHWWKSWTLPWFQFHLSC